MPLVSSSQELEFTYSTGKWTCPRCVQVSSAGAQRDQAALRHTRGWREVVARVHDGGATETGRVRVGTATGTRIASECEVVLGRRLVQLVHEIVDADRWRLVGAGR